MTFLLQQDYHNIDNRNGEGNHLSVGLGNSLQLVLLLDGVAVAGTLGGVDQLISQALSDGLDVSEGSLTSSGAQQPDSLRYRTLSLCRCKSC